MSGLVKLSFDTSGLPETVWLYKVDVLPVRRLGRVVGHQLGLRNEHFQVSSHDLEDNLVEACRRMPEPGSLYVFSERAPFEDVMRCLVEHETLQDHPACVGVVVIDPTLREVADV